MKKWVSVLLGLLCFCCFFGCEKTGPIPNGNYVWVGQNNEGLYTFTNNDIKQFCGWIVEGDNAEFWTSSQLYYQGKIVEKDGKIYFEGYKYRDWFDILFNWDWGKNEGKTDIYLVCYNAEEKSITVELYKEGD